MQHPSHVSNQRPRNDTALVLLVTLVVACGIGLLLYSQHSITGALVIPPTAPLECYSILLPNASCPATYTKILGMSNFSNAHAELPNESNYNVSICCRDPTATNTILNTSGAIVVNLSNFTNAHSGLNGFTPYSVPVRIGASVNGTSCFNNLTGGGTCGFGFTCLFTMSDLTNAHVANCSAANGYNITTCCSIGGLLTRYLAPNLTQATQLTANGTINGTLIDNDSSYATQNITYTNLTNGRRFLQFTGNFNTQDVNARALSIEYNNTAVAVNTSQVTGKSANHDLFLPNTINNVGPRICPDADNLSETNETCPNGVQFTAPYPKTIGLITVTTVGLEYQISPLTGSGAIVLTTVNSSIVASNITNSSIFNSSVVNSTIVNSTVTNSSVTNSSVLNSSITNSTLLNTSVQNSNVTNSTKINSTIINSTVTNSNNTNCILINGLEVNSSCSNSTAVNTVLNSSTLQNTSVTNSTIIGSTKINSTIINSSVQYSVNVNCTFMNSSEFRSSCLNSSVVNSTIANLTITNATIANNFCTVGVIMVSGITVNCPISLNELSPLNITISKIAVPSPVTKGQQLLYHVFITNNDNSTAFNVTLNDSAPAGTVFVNSVPAPTIPNTSWFLGTLAPGGATQVDITVLVLTNASNGSTITNNYNVTFGRSNSLNFTFTNSTVTTVLGTPNISTNKSADQPFIIKGNQLTYLIDVNNSGDDFGYNVTLTENYPTGTVFASSTPAPSSGDNTFTLGTLAPNQTTTVSITVNVTPSIPNGTIITNVYNVTTKSFQGFTVNATNSTTTLVIGYPVLNMTKTSNPTSMVPGGNVVYQITVTNTGDEIAGNLILDDGYPGNITFVSSVPPPSVGNNSFHLGNLLPGQTTTVNITVTIGTTAAPQILNNTVNATFLNSTNLTVQQNTSALTQVLPVGGQGGGSNSFVGAQIIRPRTYSMDSDSFLTPYLHRHDTVIFKTDDGLHSLNVDDVTLDTITITVASTPQTLTLSMGDHKEIDVNADGITDFAVVVVDVYHGSETQLRLVRTRGAQTTIRPEQIIRAPPTPVVSHVNPHEAVADDEPPISLPIAGEATARQLGTSSTSLAGFVLASVIIFLALGLLSYLVWNKKHPPQGRDSLGEEIGWKFRHK